MLFHDANLLLGYNGSESRALFFLKSATMSLTRLNGGVVQQYTEVVSKNHLDGFNSCTTAALKNSSGRNKANVLSNSGLISLTIVASYAVLSWCPIHVPCFNYCNTVPYLLSWL
jgi:hypothetical protein